jgi:hypothetical protein
LSDWVERYVAGQEESVWQEVVALGPRASDPAVASAVNALARETMRRALRNVETLTSLLPSIGWRFRFPLSGPPGDYCVHARPGFDVREKIAVLETLCGPLPSSLRAWWEVVGPVCFMREPVDGHEDPLPDPLVVSPIESVISEFHEWASDPDRRRLETRFRAPLAPDELHKEDISGGAPYEIELPSSAADAVLLNEWHNAMFVSYLREAFRWAGVPGWSRAPHTAARVAAIRRELVPI